MNLRATAIARFAGLAKTVLSDISHSSAIHRASLKQLPISSYGGTLRSLDRPMATNTTTSLEFLPATAGQASLLAPLVYESSHELLDFMFGGRLNAETALARLLRKPGGHFGHTFATVMFANGELVGVELGYDQRQLAAQEFAGSLNMLGAMPLSRWPHLIGRVGPALSGYVQPPSGDAYYINNIAVDETCRGSGFGKAFLEHVIASAQAKGYRCVELDVTTANSGAIRFYEKHGFNYVSESGTSALEQKFALPKLKRMRLLLTEEREIGCDNYGHATCATIVNDITGLNPVQVGEVYAPGTIEQLRHMIASTDKPVSIGGGRFSMGGQISHSDSLHIDMRGLNRILEVNADERTVKVQAGARWKDIQNVVGDYGLAVKVMQTYSSFTVGGSLSVNCHGRYVGLGPLILSVRSITLLLHDGDMLIATPTENSEAFYAAIGGYGALGIIVDACLELAENTRLLRESRKMPLSGYKDFFRNHVRNDPTAVFHNADLVPPEFERMRAITWRETERPAKTSQSKTARRLYLAERYMLWAITETPLGHFRREYFYEPLLYLRPVVKFRNEEADYDVAELEPLSRSEKTYVLQEYFVPVDRLEEFTAQMSEILKRFGVQTVNVSIRHAHPDPGSLLAWAREEVFALVLYYKQGTSHADCERVAVWTRELIDAALQNNGSYYLPYQPHARLDQFHNAYPLAGELFRLKTKYDPKFRFKNCLWSKYYRKDHEPPLLEGKETDGSEFLTVYNDIKARDDFYRFLQVVYHLYPEHEFHQLIITACERLDSDQEIYEEVARQLPEIKAFLSELTYALPALVTQKKEMQKQTIKILPHRKGYDGYLEIGSTGRYVKKLKKGLNISGSIFLSNEIPPDNSPPEIMERGGPGKVGTFFPLNDYDPIPESVIPDESLDIVTCYIGLHHCPREKLDDYIASIRRVLRPDGHFVLRDHDAGSDEMKVFASLVHTVFNAGLGVSWEEDREELRLFEGIDFWVDSVSAAGFEDSGQRLLQANDPSLNTLMCFRKA